MKENKVSGMKDHVRIVAQLLATTKVGIIYQDIVRTVLGMNSLVIFVVVLSILIETGIILQQFTKNVEKGSKLSGKQNHVVIVAQKSNIIKIGAMFQHTVKIVFGMRNLVIFVADQCGLIGIGIILLQSTRNAEKGSKLSGKQNHVGIVGQKLNII